MENCPGTYCNGCTHFFALNESIVLIEKRDEEQGTVGIKLALGASRKEMRIEALLETFLDYRYCSAVSNCYDESTGQNASIR